jgi:hypothetical protein
MGFNGLFCFCRRKQIMEIGWRPLARPLLERRAVGSDCLLQTRRRTLPRAQSWIDLNLPSVKYG